MSPLLFTSNQPFSGKSSFCVGIGSIREGYGPKSGIHEAYVYPTCYTRR